MDVTANNIANVNTVGYKSERRRFASMLSPDRPRRLRPAGRRPRRHQPDPGRPRRGAAGHPEPAHAGLAADDRPVERPRRSRATATSSSRQTTPAGGAPTDTEFTRAGNFTVDVNGDLVTPGRRVRARLEHGRGRTAPDLQRRPRRDQHPGRRAVGRRSAPTASSPTTNAAGQQIAGQIAIAKFPNPGGLTRLSDNLLRRLAELGHVRPDQPEQRRNPDRGHRELGRPRHERPRRESSRARSRCRTSTSRRSSPR